MDLNAGPQGLLHVLDLMRVQCRSQICASLYDVLNNHVYTASKMTTSPRCIRWGIVGLGDVCQTKSGPAFAKASRSQLVAVCRRTAGAAEEWARAHDVPRWYTDARDLISDPNVDAVYIATAPHSHRSLALLVAAAGKPCLMEKPLARNSSEAASIAASFQRARLPLYVAYYRRALPRYRIARDWLPRVGRLISVRAVVRRCKPDAGWRCERRISGGGYVVDVGSHVVDILDYLLGPLMVESSVAGRKCELGVMCAEGDCSENYCSFEFSQYTANGDISGSAIFDFAHDGDMEDEIVIKGSDGTITFAALGLHGSSPFVHFEGQQNDSVEVQQVQHTHLNLIEEVVSDLLGESGICSADGQAGVRAAIVIDAALERSSNHPRLSMQSFRGTSD